MKSRSPHLENAANAKIVLASPGTPNLVAAPGYKALHIFALVATMQGAILSNAAPCLTQQQSHR